MDVNVTDEVGVHIMSGHRRDSDVDSPEKGIGTVASLHTM